MNFWHFMVHNRRQVLDLTGEHLWLVGASIFLAVSGRNPARDFNHASATAE